MCFLVSSSNVIRFNKMCQKSLISKHRYRYCHVVPACVCSTCSVLKNCVFFCLFSVVPVLVLVQHSIHMAVLVELIELVELCFVGCNFVQFGSDSDFGCSMGRIVVDKLELDRPVLVSDSL